MQTCSSLDFRGRALGVALAVLPTLGVASQSNAYSIDNHARLTQQSVALVTKCRECRGAEPSRLQSFESSLIYYNVGQDALFRKLVQWHFPAQRGDRMRGLSRLLHGAALCDSFSPWIEHIWQQVAAHELSQREVYDALGAALHYVQDAAVPAHAVPIFHPTLLSPTDEFDDFASWSDSLVAQPCDELLSTCRELTPRPLPELIDETLKHTRADLERDFVASVGGDTTRVGWNRYWRAPESADDAFGSYGDISFGEKYALRRDGLYRIDESVYTAFAQQRADAAIVAGARAIVSFEAELPSECAPHCEPETAEQRDPSWLPSYEAQRALCAATEGPP